MSSASKQNDDSGQVTSSTGAANEDVKGVQVNQKPKTKQIQSQVPNGVQRRETIFSLHVHRKLTFKTIHFIEQLTALNFTTFSNITWKLLEKRWMERNSVPNFCKSLEKVGLIVAANFLMLSSSYCTGVFISLVPQFEDEFWDNGTLVQMDHLDNIDVNEGIGVLQSTGQAVTAVFGVVTGCVVTAAKGTLKGRILAINIAAGIYGVCTVVGMMLADSFWTYYVAYAMFMAGQGIVSAIALPTQLLIASSKNQLVVQGVTVISKYAGMIVGMAVTAFLFQNGGESSAYVGEYTGGFSGLQSCLNNLTGEKREDLGTFDLWACMDSRMRSYFPVAVLAFFTLCLFLINPRTWKHVCSTTSCGKRRGVFENRFYDLRSRRFSSVHPDKLAQDPGSRGPPHVGGKHSAKVAPSGAEAFSIKAEGRGIDHEQVLDLETMSEEDTMRLLFHEIFVPHSQYKRVDPEEEGRIDMDEKYQPASAAYRLHKLSKQLGIQSTYEQAERLAAYFDPNMDNSVTFQEFLEGFQRIKNTRSSEDAAVVVATSCARVWKSPDFVILTAMSSISLLVMHGLLTFSILYQIEVFGGDDDYFLNGSVSDPELENTVSTTTIQYVTAATSFVSLLLGIGVIFLIVFEKCVNVIFRNFDCNTCRGRPNATLGRVLNRGSMAYVSALSILTSGCMLFAWFLDFDVWGFWIVQMFLMSLILTLYTTIRAMMIDTVRPQDFSLALSQSSLVSQLTGATPAALMWGAIADSDLGASGAWLIFGFIPLLILPLSVTMAVRLSPDYVQERAVSHAALRLMAQAVAASGADRQNLVRDLFVTYATGSRAAAAKQQQQRQTNAVSATVAISPPPPKIDREHSRQRLTIDHEEMCIILEDILADSLSEAEAANGNAKQLRGMMANNTKQIIREDVAPLILQRMDLDETGTLDFYEFCTGLDAMIKLIAHPALSTLSLGEELTAGEAVDLAIDGRIDTHVNDDSSKNDTEDAKADVAFALDAAMAAAAV